MLRAPFVSGSFPRWCSGRWLLSPFRAPRRPRYHNRLYLSLIAGSVPRYPCAGGSTHSRPAVGVSGTYSRGVRGPELDLSTLLCLRIWLGFVKAVESSASARCWAVAPSPILQPDALSLIAYFRLPGGILESNFQCRSLVPILRLV